MSSKVSSWLSKLTRLPGQVSFRAAERTVTKAGSLEAAATELNDDALRNALRSSITPPPALPTALHLSLLREAARRSIKQRPTDAQLVLCCALVTSNVAEMDTGEGKTLGARWRQPRLRSTGGEYTSSA